VPINQSTVILANGCNAVCCFVNDNLNVDVINKLADMDIKLIALRCAGFNQVDVNAAKKCEIIVARVPDYSPHAVAEHALGLILMLNRNLHKSYNRVRENNFSLNGLMGFDLAGKTVGVIGTGKIGQVFAQIMQGLGCTVVAQDPTPDNTLITKGVKYLSMHELCATADIISLHCPLTATTKHMIDEKTIHLMKDGVMLINTSRGGLVDTVAVIAALKRKKIGYLGLDVYEEESDLFFENCSNQLLQDDNFARLLTFPNVVITGHQAFFTREALSAISNVTIENITHFEKREFEKIHCAN
jgi:D-lactate dehydrogenase